MVVRSTLVSIGLATCALVLGYAQDGVWSWTSLTVSVAGLWLFGLWRGWEWMASVGLVFFVGTAAGGIWQGLQASWMLLGVVAALTAWDLHHYAQRLKSVGWGDAPVERRSVGHNPERRHLRRLLLVNGLGLLLATVAFGTKIRINLGTAFLLGLLAIGGLSRAVGFLRREID